MEIEKTLDASVRQMGKMSADAFFHLKNSEFARHLSNAITAHKTWLNNLENMAKKRSIIPLQLDASKCGFGHFYYAMTPDIPEILPIWNALVWIGAQACVDVCAHVFKHRWKSMLCAFNH